MVRVVKHNKGQLLYSDVEAICRANAMTGKVGNETAMRAKLMASWTAVREEHLAVLFLTSCGEKSYGGLVKDLENAKLQGQDYYPKTLVESFELVLHWHDPSRSCNNSTSMKYGTQTTMATVTTNEATPTGTVLTNAGSERRGENNRLHSILCCFWCGRLGHMAGACTEVALIEGSPFDPNEHGTQNLTKNCPSKLPKHWILLDNQSTVNVFSNPAFLRNIRQVN